MSRLPSALQPLWPVAKRLHRALTRLVGTLSRLLSFGSRGVPRRAAMSSTELARQEPESVVLHRAGDAEALDRPLPAGEPPEHWRFRQMARIDVPAHTTLELSGGRVVGEWGATISRAGTLNYETSEYFGISGWQEHPLFLAPRLPEVQHLEGSAVALSTRGGSRNYYHFLLDVLPRWGVFTACVPGVEPDALIIPTERSYERELLGLTGLDQRPLVSVAPHRTIEADTLYVPCLQNPKESAPTWTVEWLRAALPAVNTDDKPRRIYVTRGGGRNTRRMNHEDSVWAMLEAEGFERIDPGTLSVRDQIDHFAAAEVIVGVHGAAMTNLLFCQPGVRVLELFAEAYVQPCFWAITTSIPGSRYEYVVDGDGTSSGPNTGVQDDIGIDATRVAAALGRLLNDR